MKKLLLILSLFLFTSCEEVVVDDVTSETTHETPATLTYVNEDVGISFEYQDDYLIDERSEMVDFDLGKMWRVSVSDSDHNQLFHLIMTSKDFVLGSSEGCCYYYSGKPIEPNLTMKELNEIWERANILTLEQTFLDERPAYSFIRANSYVSYALYDSLLLPYEFGDYTNILITGPYLEGFEYTDDYENMVLYAEDPVRGEEHEIFFEILDSLEFLEGSDT